MRLPTTVHTHRRWRIHELTRDFRLEDVWALPTPGVKDDFIHLVYQFASGKRSQGGSSLVARALWVLRWKLGKVLGWDRQGGSPGQVPTLRDRLPPDLRAGPSGPTFTGLPFKPLYMLDDEFAAEIVNRTVHGVLHLGWIPNGSGGYSAEMAVYVRPNGLLGTVYMAGIAPFRRLIVYPALMRDIASEWAAGIGRSYRETPSIPTADQRSSSDPPRRG